MKKIVATKLETLPRLNDRSGKNTIVPVYCTIRRGGEHSGISLYEGELKSCFKSLSVPTDIKNRPKYQKRNLRRNEKCTNSQPNCHAVPGQHSNHCPLPQN